MFVTFGSAKAQDSTTISGPETETVVEKKAVNNQPAGKPAKRVKKTARIQYGMASFYHNKFQGRKTSSGERYDKDKMTAAHNGLPLNTWIRVTNIRNGRTVIVKVNDRLHHRNERLVDLSRKAAASLGYIGRGLARVKVEVLGKTKPAEIAKKDH
ncbi:MAG: septal ring lytic transglycosylase RlpA family protein [Chitinophagaceae bacterium]|nr:MAG: septal ring lytic transglycosylase RlpA family protein [Chitinophagaceae bacterium]